MQGYVQYLNDAASLDTGSAAAPSWYLCLVSCQTAAWFACSLLQAVVQVRTAVSQSPG
jgi:hypothetical protein